jgi:tetratricopeptide (TPR) repeat protein
MGLTYNKNQNYNLAIECHEKAMTIRLKLLGENDGNTAASYYNLASSFYNNENYDKALNYHSLALNARIKGNCSNEKVIASSYNALGNCLAKKLQYSEAIEKYEKALEIRKNHLGDEDILTKDIYFNLSLVYFAIKDDAKSNEYLLKAN